MVHRDVDVIECLNALARMCKDSEEAFITAAAGTEDGEAKRILMQKAAERSDMLGEIRDAVRSLGGEPANSGSPAGIAYRGWFDLKASLSADRALAMLDECQRGVDMIRGLFERVMDRDMPEQVRPMLQRQYAQVLSTHDQIKLFRSARRMVS